MTDLAIAENMGPTDADPERDQLRADEAPKTYLRQVTQNTLRRTPARVGLTWVMTLLLLAVFTPFIANSSPLLIRVNDHWSSPLLKQLSPPDITLLVAFFSAIILFFWSSLKPAKRVWIWAGLLVTTIIVSVLTLHPAELVVYDQFRADQAAGKIQKLIYVPIRFSPNDHLRDQPDMRLNAPSAVHWMGTTNDSADLLSNLVAASRIALSIGFISTGISLMIGIIVGGLMGYYGGWIDLLGMRLVEIVDAIPQLLLLLIFVAVFTPNLYIMMAILGLTSWTSYAYFIRAEFLSLRDRDFVHAATAAGLPIKSVIFRHMLPNALTPLIVSASFGVARAILTESTLSFLGIGLVDEASWGNLLEQALGSSGSFYWWIALYPGLAIFLTVFAYNLIGEALRDALDPKLIQ